MCYSNCWIQFNEVNISYLVYQEDMFFFFGRAHYEIAKVILIE